MMCDYYLLVGPILLLACIGPTTKGKKGRDQCKLPNNCRKKL